MKFIRSMLAASLLVGLMCVCAVPAMADSPPGLPRLEIPDLTVQPRAFDSIATIEQPWLEAPEITFGRVRAQATAVTDAPAFSWAGAFIYDFTSHRFDGIVLNNTFPLHTPGGHNTGFSLGFFGGAAGNSQANALAGVGLMASKVIFKEISGWLLAGGAVQGGTGTAFHVVGGGGLAVKF